MKRLASSKVVAALTVLLSSALFGQTTKPAASQDGITVLFAPGNRIADANLSRIASAKINLDIQASDFTSAPIAQAIAEARTRGVAVRIILDSSPRNTQYSSAAFFRNLGIPTYIDSKHGGAHGNLMIVDHQVVITGSFNFTAAAEEGNAETLIIIEGKRDIVASFERNFTDHYMHSAPYDGQAEAREARPVELLQPDPPAKQPARPAVRPIPAPTIVERRADNNDTPPATPATITVYVTRTWTVYHLAGCSYLRASAIPISLPAAKARGLPPCSRCRPPY